MAKITLDLNQFKASGVYTVEFDASERVILSTETIRLVVGFSRRGPFNAPVFLRDLKTARTVFGNIDTFLEKRGSYFHRAIETCLQTGPIFALNLLPLNNVPLNEGGDGVQYRSFAVDVDEENGPISRDLLASFYNKERFWFADTDNFIAIANNNPLNKGRLLSLTNVSQTPMSFIVRKPDPAVQGYAVTAREWYGAGNVPDFIYEFDFIEDYFLELIAIEGDWTDYKTLSEDPVFSRYFDRRGIIISRLNEFLALEETTTVANFIGSIIPDFVDGNGSNQFIEVLVNQAVGTTGIFLAVNREELDDYANSTYKVDLVGHSLISTSDDTIDFLSYNTPISKAVAYDDMNIYINNATPVFTENDYAAGAYSAAYVTSSPIGGTSGLFGNVLVVPKPAPTEPVFNTNKYQELLDGLTNISLVETVGKIVTTAGYGLDYVKVDDVIDNGTEFRVILSNPNAEAPSYVIDAGSPSSTVGSVNTVAGTITLATAPAGVTNNSIAYITAPGYSQYFECTEAAGVLTLNGTAANPGITTISMDHNPASYCAGDDELLELATAIAAGTFYAEDVSITIWSDYGTHAVPANNDLVPNLLTSVAGNDGISVVYSPDAVFNHENETTYTTVAQITSLMTVDEDFDINGNIATFPGDFAGASIADQANNLAVFLTTLVGTNNLVAATSDGVDSVTIVFDDNAAVYSFNINAGAGAATFTPASGSFTDQSDYTEAYPGAKLSKDIQANRIVDGDYVYYNATDWNYLNVDEQWGGDFDVTSNLKYGLIGTRVRQYSNVGLTTQITGTASTPPFVDIVTTNESYVAGGGIYGDGGNNDLLLYSAAIENLKTTVDIITGTLNAPATQFRIAEGDSSLLEVGYFLVNAAGTHLTRVTSKIKRINQTTGVVEYEINTTVGVQVTGVAPQTVLAFTPINSYVDRLQFTNLTGFALNEYHLPSNQSQLEKIYGVIENTNLGITLASKDIITFRYLIDTFGFGIAPQMGPKSILTRLAKNRQKCMAILNAPSIQEFMDSTDPRFTDDPNPSAGNPRPTLNAEYISTGGNLSIGPSFTFSLPDEENGAKFMGAFTPWLTVRENNKNITVPPAADVSNNFIRKFLNGQPYSIVAGPRRGILSNTKLVGLEYEYTLQDREYIEPFGLNPIVTVRNVGIMIYGNQSGYQRTLSAFNNLHVRDLLITVESAVEDVLTQYLFEFNDAATRLEIKSIVENYMENVRNAGGIFDFLVIMDETNNTAETIDQNFGIIDIGIEPSRGMQKFVNRVTILKTGAIASGGFTIA